MKSFAGKRVLMLQGPVGPFFSRLARDLESMGARVSKVNFNGGDWLFSPKGPVNFRGRIEDWPDFFERLLDALSIDVVFLFGDCRRIHTIAREIARRRGVVVGVFEEGYVRPDFITLEEYGVNGYSSLPSSPDLFLQDTQSREDPVLPVGNTFWRMGSWAMMYYLSAAFARPLFRHYRHHRPLTLAEALPWIRALWRKLYYSVTEDKTESLLKTSLSGNYYLVPLQVYNDGQIHIHSSFGSVSEFILHTLKSFAGNAPAGTFLVYKHHPLDRGYNDYSRLIRMCARELRIEGRVLYVHDLRLPGLLQHARGVVVINSTVGLSAIHHGTPVKTCGNATYDLAGLTFQGSLDSFWKAARDAAPDNALYLRFRRYVVEHTQLNGSFYKRLDAKRSRTGINWENFSSVKYFKTDLSQNADKQFVPGPPVVSRRELSFTHK